MRFWIRRVELRPRVAVVLRGEHGVTTVTRSDASNSRHAWFRQHTRYNYQCAMQSRLRIAPWSRQSRFLVSFQTNSRHMTRNIVLNFYTGVLPMFDP